MNNKIVDFAIPLTSKIVDNRSTNQTKPLQEPNETVARNTSTRETEKANFNELSIDKFTVTVFLCKILREFDMTNLMTRSS